VSTLLTYVVVTGPPASGKSTLSRALAAELDLPLLAKDDLKQDLLDRHPAATVEESRRAGRAAVRAMLTAAREAGRGVLDSVWVDRGQALRELATLGDVVEVFCRCEVDTMRGRYLRRAPAKGPGHFDEQRPETELWPGTSLHPLAGGWPVVEVRTDDVVDVRDVVARLRRARPADPGLRRTRSSR
jgi:predicted kinase